MSAIPAVRPSVSGKFLQVSCERFWVRGVTYGAFRPAADGCEYQDRDTLERDFAEIAGNGFNAVRIPHTTPPLYLLEAAQRHGLRVMVGLSAEQYVGYLSDPAGAPDIEGIVRARVRLCARHPALLCYAIGNEIPAPIVRWHGRRRIEGYLRRLHRAIKAEDPDSLVTYVNYPSTEYLQLPFLDFVSFNVYLESPERFEAYVARLHNLAGNRPVMLSEIGLDSLRHGEEAQARALDWQVRKSFAAGCVGGFVFSWTDEWYRGGADVEDWAFGLTRRDRRPKPALGVVRNAMSQVPFAKDLPWPRVSVVVCSHNGAPRIRECLDGMLRLEYPDFEVIVVDDGSSDGTGEIARQYGARVISAPHGGLSRARNIGLQAATGQIVAYIDDDAYPDPHWLTYLAAGFLRTTHAGIGGPNLPPPSSSAVAQCVASAPGGPVHVLLTDEEAEHIPGCNMAFRKSVLEEIGGFDPQFRTAGDDVDLCWRLRQSGQTLGFSPAAVVWHHRRPSVRAFWRQQRGYGHAEALLERKWPEKYNALGHLAWAGRVYGPALPRLLGRPGRIYHGVGGTAPFQSLYEPAAGWLSAVMAMPEWYLVIVAMAGLTTLGALWTPLLLLLPVSVVAIGVPLTHAAMSAGRAFVPPGPTARLVWMRGLIALLFLLQPLARLYGRLSADVALRPRRVTGFAWPWSSRAFWRTRWRDASQWLGSLHTGLRELGVSARPGGAFDRWDVEARGGRVGSARLFLAIEDHGAGRQLVRFRVRPACSPWGVVAMLVLVGLSAGAAVNGVWSVATILGTAALLLGLRAARECGAATAAIRRVWTDMVRNEA